MTDSHEEPVLLMTAKTPFEAKVVVGVLQGAGIPAFNATGNLMDEFAMTQRLMNLQAVEVKVPADRLADAQRAVAEAREAGEFIDAENED